MRRPRHPPSITLPSKAALKDLARDQKLEPGQVVALEEAICTAEWDLRTYLASALAKDERQRLVKSLKKTSQQLARLITVMQETCDDLDRVLPKASQDAIDDAFTPAAKRRLLGAALGISGPLAAHRWETLALKHPGALLMRYLETVQMPLATWLELDQRNRGGRPADLARWHLVRRLAEASEEILGRRPATSSTGPFVELCVAVFIACGMDEAGVEKLVPKVVRSLRDRSQDVKP
jgi:hypothetical protein